MVNINDYNWYEICNVTEFEAADIPSRTYTMELEGLGVKDILVTKGFAIGITYEGIFLSLGMNDENPFGFEDMAIYKDANEILYLGFIINAS